MADSHAQTVEIRVITQFADDVFKAVVAAMTAAQFELRHPWRQVQFVVGHQDLIRIDAIKRCHSCHGFAAQVHKGGWHQQPHVSTRKIDA